MLKKRLRNILADLKAGRREWPPLLEVLWFDAQGEEDESGELGEVGSLGMVRTAGYFANIRISPPAVTLAGDSWRDEGAKHHTLRSTTTIPLDWVVACSIDGEVFDGPAARYLPKPPSQTPDAPEEP